MVKKAPQKLAPEELAVGSALRFRRMRQKFSQQEIAEMVGTTRSTISNIEYGNAKVPFSVGYEFCRRLDLSLALLVTGNESGPFVSPQELGVSEDTVRSLMKRRTGFLDAYNRVFKAPLEAWAKSTPQVDIITRILRRSPQTVARSMSMEALLESIPQLVQCFLKATDAETQRDFAVMASAQLLEVKERLEAQNPELRR